MSDHSLFYHDPRTDQMDQEIAAFEAMKATLLAHHLGEYVAIFQGAVATKRCYSVALGKPILMASFWSGKFDASHVHLSFSAHHGYIRIDELAIVEKGSTSNEE